MTSNFPGRNRRRRRVLKEEVLSASSSHVAMRATADDEQSTCETPRYSEAAGVEHHPQVTDFVPRRYRSIAAIGLGGVATVAVCVILNQSADPIAATLGMANARPFDLSVAGSLADWSAAVVLLLTSAVCLLVYSIRRHRIDDIRGRYRVWYLATVACLVMSADSVADLHRVLTNALSHFTGWTPMSTEFSWLAILCLPIAWVAIRALVDAYECRLAGTLLVFGLACFAVALASSLRWLPSIDLRIETSVTAGSSLLGHWALLVGTLVYARYIVLDAQGLISVRRQTARRLATDTQGSKMKLHVVGGADSSQPSTAENRAKRKSSDEIEWIDGSQPERDEYDAEVIHRHLSKAERKRLRKIKAQNRAA